MADIAPGAKLVRAVSMELTDDQIALMKRTICKPKNREATNDELSLFVGQCKRTGLDPFAKQIYAIFRYSTKAKAEVMTIQTSIDGFRVIAERTGKFLGKTKTLWCDAEGKWSDVWLKDEHPHAAKVIVRKKVGRTPTDTPAVAHWKEYADESSPMWKSMPANQLAKCAEALALRQAFPNDLSGLYTIDEMGRADREQRDLTAGSGGELSGIELGEDAEALLARAAALGHAGLADRGTAEMMLAGASDEARAEWLTLGQTILDDLEASPVDAEAVSS